jgi:hypothetical protein
VDLGAIILREANVGEDVRLGLAHQFGELGHFGPELVGDLAPLQLGGLSVVLGGGGEKRRGDPATLAAEMSHKHFA